MKIFYLIVLCSFAAITSPYSIKALGLSLHDLILLPILCFGFYKFQTGKYKLSLSQRRIVTPLISFVSLISVSYVINGYYFQDSETLSHLGYVTSYIFPKLASLGFISIFIILVTFITISVLHLTDAERALLYIAIVIGGAINASLALVSWLTETGGVLGRYNFVPPLEGSQGIHVSFMIITVLLGIALLRSDFHTSVRTTGILLTCVVLAMLSLVTVMVREGWIIFFTTLAMTSFFYMTFKGSFVSKIAPVLLVLVVGGVLIYLLIGENFLADILFLDDGHMGDSAAIRSLMIDRGLEIAKNSPFVGIGYGMYATQGTQLIYFVAGGEPATASSPHNGLITLAAETGVAGVLCIALLSFRVLSELRQKLRNSGSSLERAVASVVFSYLLVMVFDQLVSNSILIPPPAERNVAQLSFLIWVLIASVMCNSRVDFNYATDSRNH